MAKRALIIGSQTGELQGVHNDVERIAAKLREKFRFDDVTKCIEGDATRAGILDKYNRLIDSTQPGDAVVVYYSGHGGLVRNSSADGPPGVPSHFQFIVPMDIEESKPGDFRGILNVELSLMLRRLTAKTHNAAVILDCCHSAQISRDIRLQSRAWQSPFESDISALVAEFGKKSPDLGHAPTDPAGNPHAVRLVASALTESAFEYRNPKGEYVGVMTESLLLALDDAATTRVSWNILADRVRERVLSIVSSQHVGLEGAEIPRQRVLFGTEVLQEEPSASVSIDRDGRLVIGAGRIMGVHVGDEYLIMPAGAKVKEMASAIAQIRIASVQPAISSANGNLLNEHRTIPDGSRAFPIGRAAVQRRVILDAQGPERSAVETILREIPALEVVEKEEDRPFLAKVRVQDGAIVVLEPSGTPVWGDEFSELAARAAASHLHMMCVAQGLRELEGRGIPDILPGQLKVEWGRVEDGRKVSLEKSGQTIAVGESVYVTVRNQSPKTVFVSIFDIGIRGKVTLLSRDYGQGMEIGPGMAKTLGEGSGGKLLGMRLKWPENWDPDGPRLEEIIMIVTDSPVNLRALETPGAARAQAGSLHVLQQVAKQLAGGTRDLTASEPEEDQFLVERIDFLLDPWPYVAAEQPGTRSSSSAGPTFIATASVPPNEAITRSGGGFSLPFGFSAEPSSPQRKLAIRIREMAVHKNGTIFPFATDLRLDAVIVTRMQSGQTVPYHPVTFHFPNIKKGERLPFDDLLVYQGDVLDFVDMAIWVSRADAKSPSLDKLLVDEASKLALVVGPFLEAATGLPKDTVNAATQLLTVVHSVLEQAVSKTVGMYRRSFLATDNFRIGKHPRWGGTIQAQDFSFAYEVVET